jgi:hypothetical protein
LSARVLFLAWLSNPREYALINWFAPLSPHGDEPPRYTYEVRSSGLIGFSRFCINSPTVYRRGGDFDGVNQTEMGKVFRMAVSGMGVHMPKNNQEFWEKKLQKRMIFLFRGKIHYPINNFIVRRK